ncbi:MAG: hypothetical protein Q9160_001407 [Pyrenula sp. 1 TL-2023]
MSKIGVIRTVSEDDYLTMRAANPQTGLITPSIYSDNASLVDSPAATKWRRVGDAWISIGIEQDTPDSSPPASTYGIDTRTLQNHGLPLNTPEVPRTDSTHATFTSHKRSIPLPGKRTKPIRSFLDTLSLQRKVSQPQIGDSLPNIQDTSSDKLPMRPGHTSRPMKLRRKAVRSSLTQPQRKRVQSSYASGVDSNGFAVASTAPISTSERYRSTSTPRDSCKYFSPDDVGKDLPSQYTESASTSELKPTEPLPCSEAFLGPSPGDFIEDIPVQFQKIPDRLYPERQSTPLPTNAGRFHLPASTNLCKNGQQRGFPETKVVVEGGTPISRPYLTRGLHPSIYQGPDHQTLSSSQRLFPPTNIAHHHPIRPDSHQRSTVDRKLSNGLHQSVEIGAILSAKGPRNLTNKIRINVPQTTQYTDTNTSTIITSQTKTDNIPQALSEAPHSKMQVNRQPQPTPAQKSDYGGKSVLKVSQQQQSPMKTGILDTNKAKTNTSRAIFTSQRLDHIPMLHTRMVDGAADFESGSMIENQCQMTNPLSTKEDIRWSRRPPIVKTTGTAGHIPTSETQATHAPRVSPSTVVQEVSHGVENECGNGGLLADPSFLGSKKALLGHEDCCPTCCEEDCHNSCLGHDYDSSKKGNNNDYIDHSNHKGSESGPFNPRQSYRTQRHESDPGSFIETKAEYFTDLAQPLQNMNRKLMLSKSKAENTHKLLPNYSTFLLSPVRVPLLLSIVESLLVPLKSALKWCRYHPEVLDLAALALSRIMTMALHVLQTAATVYEGWAEYRRSGSVALGQDRMGLLKLGGMALYESMVVVCAVLVTFRVVGLAFALVGALWGAGKMMVWVLGVGFGSGML